MINNASSLIINIPANTKTRLPEEMIRVPSVSLFFISQVTQTLLGNDEIYIQTAYIDSLEIITIQNSNY